MATQPQPQPKPPTPPAPPKPPEDPQAAKLEAHAAPPRWEEPKKDATPRVEWNPKPSFNPREETPPPGVYPDGMPIAEEQRLRSAAIEQAGMEEYMDFVEERPHPDQHTQVPGVAPPAKRS
jgi:hypothetical protein